MQKKDCISRKKINKYFFNISRNENFIYTKKQK